MKLCIKASQFPDHIGNLLHVCQGFEPEQLIDIQIDKHRQRRSLDANAYCWVLLDKLAAACNTQVEDGMVVRGKGR